MPLVCTTSAAHWATLGLISNGHLHGGGQVAGRRHLQCRCPGQPQSRFPVDRCSPASVPYDGRIFKGQLWEAEYVTTRLRTTECAARHYLAASVLCVPASYKPAPFFGLSNLSADQRPGGVVMARGGTDGLAPSWISKGRGDLWLRCRSGSVERGAGRRVSEVGERSRPWRPCPSPNLFAAISPLSDGCACRRLSVSFSVNGLSCDAFLEDGREF